MRLENRELYFGCLEGAYGIFVFQTINSNDLVYPFCRQVNRYFKYTSKKLLEQRVQGYQTFTKLISN